MKLEQEFFKAFGKKPKTIYEYYFKLENNPEYYTWSKHVVIDLVEQGNKISEVKIVKTYPPITPGIKIKLIEMIIKIYGYISKTQYKYLLRCCIYHKDEIQDQVQQLFKGAI